LKFGQFTLRAGITFALWSMLGVGLLNAGTARAAGSAADNAFVRVVHAAPFDEHVDVFVDNSAQPLLTGFTFSNVTDYLPLPAGTHSIQVVPTGQGKDKAVITQSISVQAGAFYTVALIGDKSTQPGLVVFTDGTSVPADKAVLRVYHLSSDAGPLAVSSAGKTVIDRLRFESASNYLTFSPDQSIFTVTLLDKDIQQETLDATFEPNRISSVFVLGLTSIVDSTGFKFVTKLTASVPAALPSTGFAPRSSSDDGIPPSTVYMLAGLAAVALLGGTRLALARRRARSAPVPNTADYARLFSERTPGSVARSDSER
jgi:Domain of unknown function (DUF4397)